VLQSLDKCHRVEGVFTGKIIAEMALSNATTLEQKKARTGEVTTKPEVEETSRASFSESMFPRDYVLPRKDDVKPINLIKDAKYNLVTPEILVGVIIDEDMLGKVSQLKYVNHNITYTKKFPNCVEPLLGEEN
jgi:hypothetical protein